MPITLGCPACGKRFRARDESAGKRVKCPYCAEPVPVPTGDEQEQEQAQQVQQQRSPLMDDDDGIGTVPTRQNPVPGPTVASPTDWGADSPPPRQSPFPPVQNVPPGPAPVFPPPVMRTTSSPDFDPFPKLPPAAAAPVPIGRSAGRESMSRLGGAPPRPLGTGIGAGPVGAAAVPVEPFAIPGWKKAHRGLFWVILGLLLLILPGLVGLAKAACVKGGVALPRGPGGDWVSISGYVNTTDPNSVMLSKEELIDLAGYGAPIVLGGLCLALGRLACGGVPRSSGAKGAFILSGLATPFAAAALIAAVGTDKLMMHEEYQYARYAFLILAVAAEFWFLTGLTAASGALRRPEPARAVGFFGLVVVLAAAAATIGWLVYTKRFQPRPMTDMIRLYEQAAIAGVWLLAIGAYVRAVRSTRRVLSEYLETVEV